MDKVNFKKTDKKLYQLKNTSAKIRVPSMTFIMVNSKGNPNDAGREFSRAVGLLDSLSYTIKMSKKGSNGPTGY